jgi:hypothetical protein
MAEFKLNHLMVWPFSRYERPRHNENIWMVFVERVVDHAHPQRHFQLTAQHSLELIIARRLNPA